MNNSTLVMIAVLAAVAMLSAAVVVVPIQQASAQDTLVSNKNKRTHVVVFPAVVTQAQ